MAATSRGSGVDVDVLLGGVQLAKLLAGEVVVDPDEDTKPDKFAEKPLLILPLAVGVMAVRFSSTEITFEGEEMEALVVLFMILLESEPLPPPP